MKVKLKTFSILILNRENNNSNNVFNDYSLCISEIYDSNYPRHGKKELGIFGYCKVLAVPMKWYSVI